jgi:hypothetical protein
VTPPGDTATSPGAAVGVSEGSDAPDITVVVVFGADVAGSLSLPDEHPVPTAVPTITSATALAARRECLRMQPIYAMAALPRLAPVYFGSP